MSSSQAAQHQGEVVITWNEDRTQILAVTRQDEEGRILSVLAEAPVVELKGAEVSKEVQLLLDDLRAELCDDPSASPDDVPAMNFDRLVEILSVANGSDDDLADAKEALAQVFFECARYERPSTEWIQALDDFCHSLLIRSKMVRLSPEEIQSCLPVSPLSKKPQVWLTQKDAVAAIGKAVELMASRNQA